MVSTVVKPLHTTATNKTHTIHTHRHEKISTYSFNGATEKKRDFWEKKKTNEKRK